MSLRPWFDRTFTFDHLTAEDYPFLVERLRGVPARLTDKLERLSREALTRREGASWSLQQHVGHLTLLDSLHDGRLDDYAAGAEALRPADLRNRRTHEGGFDERALEELLAALRTTRERLVARLDAWEPTRVLDAAVHPRLGQPMRVVDMVFFAAEHDDHHLAVMSDIVRRSRA